MWGFEIKERAIVYIYSMLMLHISIRVYGILTIKRKVSSWEREHIAIIY